MICLQWGCPEKGKKVSDHCKQMLCRSQPATRPERETKLWWAAIHSREKGFLLGKRVQFTSLMGIYIFCYGNKTCFWCQFLHVLFGHPWQWKDKQMGQKQILQRWLNQLFMCVKTFGKGRYTPGNCWFQCNQPKLHRNARRGCLSHSIAWQRRCLAFNLGNLDKVIWKVVAERLGGPRRAGAQSPSLPNFRSCCSAEMIP